MMIRFLLPVLLASSVSAAPTNAQESGGKSSPHHSHSDIAQAFQWRTPVDPTGEYVYIDAYVDLGRVNGAFPPEGITAEMMGLGGPPCYPIYRLRVPAGRVSKIQELLKSLAPRVTTF